MKQNNKALKCPDKQTSPFLCKITECGKILRYNNLLFFVVVVVLCLSFAWGIVSYRHGSHVVSRYSQLANCQCTGYSEIIESHLEVFPFSQGWCRQLLFQQAAGNLMDSIYLSKDSCISLPGKSDTAFSTNMDCLCVVLPLTPLQ